MPEYTATNLFFHDSDIRPNFVRDFFDAMNEGGYPFLKGYYSAEDWPLEKIIDWNQKKLEERFILGLHDSSEVDYKQTLLKSHFSEMRVFWSYFERETGFGISVIVPEHEVYENIDECKDEFIKLSKLLWLWLKPYLISISFEMEDPLGILNIFKKGEVVEPKLFLIASLVEFPFLKNFENYGEITEGNGLLVIPRK
jgi:hypothetical protein